MNLVGCQRLNISGDRATISTEVMSTWGHFYSEQENGVVTGYQRFGVPKEISIEFNQGIAPEDDLLEHANLGEFPDGRSESWQLCIFNSDFPELERLKSIVKSHGSVLFQPFDKEGLRVSPLKLKVHPSASRVI